MALHPAGPEYMALRREEDELKRAAARMPEVTSAMDLQSAAPKATRGAVGARPPEPNDRRVQAAAAAARDTLPPGEVAPDPVSEPERDPELDAEELENIWGILEGLVDAFGRSRPLPDDVRELLRRTAEVQNAVERVRSFELRTSGFASPDATASGGITASILFVAAVLWGREAERDASVPPVAARLALLVARHEGFREAFVSPLLGGSEQITHPKDIGPFSKARVFTEPSSALKRNLKASAGDATVESILVRILEPSTDVDLLARLEVASLERMDLIAAIRGQSSATKFVGDHPQTTRDSLGRGALAFAFAHLTCQIFESQQADGGASAGGSFVMHVDAPWGGGKTTFANFLRAILSAAPAEREALAASLNAPFATTAWPRVSPAATRTEGEQPGPKWRILRWLRRAIVGPEAAPGDLAGPPWLCAEFNAWRNEHVQPAWWNFHVAMSRQLRRSPVSGRLAKWLLFEEYRWRYTSQDNLIGLASFLVLVASAIGLAVFNFPGLFDEDTPKSSLNLLLFVIAGGSGYQVFSSLRSGTEWIIRAAGRGGDAGALGVVDPLERFNAHHRSFCAELKRPILVVIDDLDRCQPAYVVDLIRGLLTVFNAPQVVYLLLGDRAWIETCFARAHEKMMVDPHDEITTFGGHFAEKAIQLSFLLPTTSGKRVGGYFDGLLSTPSARSADAMHSTDGSPDGVTNAPAPGGAQAESAALGAGAPTGAQRNQSARERDAVDIARQAKNRDDIQHRLQDLRHLLPANPRQVKRIVNMVALYQASALAVLGIEQGSREWRAMVIWILLLNAHPVVWLRLGRDPRLVDRLEAAAAGSKDPVLARFLASDFYDKVFKRPLPGAFSDARPTRYLIAEKLVPLMPPRQDP